MTEPSHCNSRLRRQRATGEDFLTERVFIIGQLGRKRMLINIRN
jgi:hypothetical protein